jgi:alpha-1,3/alpha-1,6-mannosyltransferase
MHPDLGLGGAERLVVDAAVALGEAGHRVTVLTGHHDRRQAFPETTDGTLDVRVAGRFVPAHVGQRLRAPCAIARMACLAVASARLPDRPDVVFCDLVAHVVPLVRRLHRVPVVFYCHYPDRLLAPRREGVYRWYRAPIDRLEQVGLAQADRVLVNSRFTATRLRQAFPELRGLEPVVLHPGVAPMACPDLSPDPGAGPILLLCIGRYDPQKNLGLAVAAVAGLREHLSPAAFDTVRLVVAGGYDRRLREQRDTLQMLEALVRRLGLEHHVTLRSSLTEGERRELLSACRCVVYTPEDEHFGYVPVEAMAAGRPVIAVNSGGPAETVVHGSTGLLCPPRPDAFAAALARVLGDPAAAAAMGQAGRVRVRERFSRLAFARGLEAILGQVAAR